MLILFGILIVLTCVLLGVIILIQNPKGGGLSGTLGGVGSQVMGVRQTTDALEKGTWILATIIAVLCMTSTIFTPKGAGGQQQKGIMEQNIGNTAPAPMPSQAPANTATLPTAPADSQAQ
ncbi:preprotein translocase subunit SecG [Chitinophaga caeni]|uniref:Protein-export membrane protein SecG n=1 Tax=Chitinophaga caeni TaxID=2029983 RepID=A0A291QW68_9BACT|nr:preprotein translocase subunit SecG [Chitinophaga caeni]ATL48103.1 preprotein translocase subunit SecG [Chitinophaga caeni]